MQVERVDHHEIIGQAEIFHCEALRIDQAAVGRPRHVADARDAMAIGRRVVAVGEGELAATCRIAEFVDRAGVGTGAAKWRQIGNDGVRLIHHRFIAFEDRQRRVGGGEIDGVIERIESGQAVGRANLDLVPSDLDRIRQEHVGACQVDFHRKHLTSVGIDGPTPLPGGKR